MWVLKQGDLVAERYRVERVLGSGGMSYVYAAKDEELGETIALKILQPKLVDEKDLVERFKREVRIARQIQHPNIIRIFEYGKTEVNSTPLYYLTMELLQGEELSAWLKRRGRPNLAEVFAVATQLCDALGEAHRVGIVHRDLKPANIFMHPSGRIKIMDFGISRLSTLTGVTQGSQMMGTPQYMSPEQALGRQVDHRTDIYALGVVVYQLSVGRCPFEADQPMGVVYQHIEKAPPSMRQFDESIPESLDRAVLACLEKNSAQRFQTADDFRAALDHVALELGLAPATLATGSSSAPGVSRPPTRPPIDSPSTILPPTTKIPSLPAQPAGTDPPRSRSKAVSPSPSQQRAAPRKKPALKTTYRPQPPKPAASTLGKGVVRPQIDRTLGRSPARQAAPGVSRGLVVTIAGAVVVVGIALALFLLRPDPNVRPPQSTPAESEPSPIDAASQKGAAPEKPAPENGSPPSTEPGEPVTKVVSNQGNDDSPTPQPPIPTPPSQRPTPPPSEPVVREPEITRPSRPTPGPAGTDPVASTPTPAATGESDFLAGEQAYEAQNYPEALRRFREAADAGHVEAMSYLGFLYYQGQGVGTNYQLAANWFQKAADGGDADAMNNLGMMHQNGEGIPENPASAAEWFRRAADAGSTAARYNLAFMYRQGIGVAKDDAKAVELLRSAALAGDVRAMNDLAFMFHKGQGVPANIASALEWYRRAVDAGEPSAMFNLGNLYYEGKAVEQDYAEAFRLFERGAKLGNGSAMNFLGHLYQDGLGTDKDPLEALSWFRRSAQLGNASAMYNLGHMYENGLGLERNLVQARDWYEKSAARKDPNAAYALGRLYERGLGVDRDRNQAREWYRQAAALGHQDAEVKLRQLR